jgi:hypothetical protein
MLKRVRWMVVGMGVSTVGKLWAKRKVSGLMQHYSPPQVASRAALSAKEQIRAAVEEGREAMRRREAELRATPRPVPEVPGVSLPRPPQPHDVRSNGANLPRP